MTVISVLKDCPVFSGLSEDELKKIATCAVEKAYEAGTTIFQEGDGADDFFVLEEGKVALQMSLPRAQERASRRVTVDLVFEPDVFGWSAIVGPHTYRLAAVCLQNVKALSISGAKLRAVLETNPRIGYQVLNELAKVIASRLEDTRRVLVSERMVTPRLVEAVIR